MTHFAISLNVFTSTGSPSSFPIPNVSTSKLFLSLLEYEMIAMVRVVFSVICIISVPGRVKKGR